MGNLVSMNKILIRCPQGKNMVEVAEKQSRSMGMFLEGKVCSSHGFSKAHSHEKFDQRINNIEYGLATKTLDPGPLLFGIVGWLRSLLMD
jgi:hypothetical protein